uniref:Uncharacterized protein n=1 Tax=Anguilla anguilla TaxID=7936 RepID=A0A0E9XP67_ANGAN
MSQRIGFSNGHDRSFNIKHTALDISSAYRKSMVVDCHYLNRECACPARDLKRLLEWARQREVTGLNKAA